MIGGSDTYIVMLGDILKEKKQVMEAIFQLTQGQEAALAPENEDLERFDAGTMGKEPLIARLAELDTGFSDIYEKVRATLQGQKEQYMPKIQELQTQITELTDLSVRLQALEERNRQLFERYLMGKRQQFKEVRKHTRTADAYTKTMSTTPQGEAYFMDKKK